MEVLTMINIVEMTVSGLSFLPTILSEMNKHLKMLHSRTIKREKKILIVDFLTNNFCSVY